MQPMFLTLAVLCLPLGAVVIASLAAALLAPLDSSGRRTVLRSQWCALQTPIVASPADPESAEAVSESARLPA